MQGMLYQVPDPCLYVYFYCVQCSLTCMGHV